MHQHASAPDKGEARTKQTSVDSLKPVRKHYQNCGISKRGADILLSSWRDATKKQYNSYIKRWIRFCGERNVNIMSSDLKDVINFMTMCMDELKLGYSALNTVRTSLSSFIMIDSHSIGSHPIISRFMKGVFQIKPAIPKNNVIWDTSIVLAYLKTLSPVRKLPIMELTKKAVTLSALLTGQQCQTLIHMDIRNIDINKSRICVTFGDLLKQSRPGCYLQQLTVKGYPPDRRLCLTTVLMEYMARVEDIRGHETRQFLTTKKPFKAASRPTVSRWVKQTLASAGVNMNIFTPHSTRSASTSTAMHGG